MFAYRLDLSYEGTEFHGFARQPTVRTVQGELEKALSLSLREDVLTTCAGRTDAGVHARRQVVSMNLSRSIDDKTATMRSLNRLLPPDMAVHDLSATGKDWSARFSAKWRAYRYFLHTAAVADPLRRRQTWHVGVHLDVEAMNEVATHFVGVHDFSSFCRSAEGRSNVREVRKAVWSSYGPDTLVFEVEATSFCHQMVRSLVGWCVEVGRGRREASRTPHVIAARSRQAAGPVAPPHGLVLWEVGYEMSEEENGGGLGD